MKNCDAHVQAWLELGCLEFVPDFEETDSHDEWILTKENSEDWQPVMFSWTTLHGFSNAMKVNSISVMYDYPYHIRTICLRCGENISNCTCDPMPFCVECRMYADDCDC